MENLGGSWRSNVYRSSLDDSSYFRTPGWKRLRQLVLKRDRQFCQRCDRHFRKNQLTVHHLLPRADGGWDDMSNLVTLCGACHNFVEINNLRTLAEIVGSSEGIGMETLPKQSPEDDSWRPNWHKWVYGGVHRTI